MHGSIRKWNNYISMITTIAIIILLILFHHGPLQIVKGFIDGYRDAKDGRPFDPHSKEE